MQARSVINHYKRAYNRLPPDLRKILFGYIIVVHILLFIALIK